MAEDILKYKLQLTDLPENYNNELYNKYIKEIKLEINKINIHTIINPDTVQCDLIPCSEYATSAPVTTSISSRCKNRKYLDDALNYPYQQVTDEELKYKIQGNTMPITLTHIKNARHFVGLQVIKNYTIPNNNLINVEYILKRTKIQYDYFKENAKNLPFVEKLEDKKKNYIQTMVVSFSDFLKNNPRATIFLSIKGIKRNGTLLSSIITSKGGKRTRRVKKRSRKHRRY